MSYIINKILAYFFAYVTFIHCTTTKAPKPFNQRKPVRLAIGTARGVVGFAKGTLKGAPIAAVGGLGVAAGIAAPYWHGGESFSAGLGFLAKGIASPFQYAHKSFKKGYYRPEYNAKKQEYKAAMAQGNFDSAKTLAKTLDKLNTDFIRTKKYTKQVQAKQHGNAFSGSGNGDTPHIQQQNKNYNFNPAPQGRPIYNPPSQGGRYNNAQNHNMQTGFRGFYGYNQGPPSYTSSSPPLYSVL